MSIAVTVVIAPSRCLRILLAGFGASLLAAACAVCFATPPGFAAAALVAAALLFAGVCVLHAALRPPMVHRIDISGPGRIRLTVQQGVRQDKQAALPARLLPGSTLWPRLLLLRLETGVDDCADGSLSGAGEGAHGWCARRRLVSRASGRIGVVVLADSVPPEAFRALVVALGSGDGVGGVPPTRTE